MNDTVMEKRRALLQAWTGTVGVAGLLGLAPASAQAQPDTASVARTAGKRPLYSASKTTKAAPAPTLAASPTPDENIRVLRRLTFGYREQDLVDFLAHPFQC